jgi:hypothetical protein
MREKLLGKTLICEVREGKWRMRLMYKVGRWILGMMFA